ncbi:MAG: sodium-dependent transporter [Candidatus Micrarchaeota archaeon]
MVDEEKREHWTNALAFVIASIGSAVGLGNIWRFPYIMGQHGGVSFLVPYIACLILIGFPFMLLEFGAGRYFAASLPSVFRKLKLPAWLGWIPVAFCTIILSYYLVVTSWTLMFAVLYAVRGSVGMGHITESYLPFVFFLITAVLIAVVDAAGVKRGLEKANIVLLPLLFASLALLACVALSLPGTAEKLADYARSSFSFEGALNANTWLYALSQAIFSLSIGYGILLTYGSYLDKRTDITKSSVLIMLGDFAVSIVASVFIFSLAFYGNVAPESGFALAFATIPHLFASIPFGNIFGTLFFLLLFAAAFTSSLSMFEVPVAAFIDEQKKSRKNATRLAFAVIVLLAIPSLLSYSPLALNLGSMPVLDALDLIFGSMLAPISALIVCVGIAWFWKNGSFVGELGIKNEIPRKILEFSVKWEMPIVMMFLFVLGITSGSG